MKKIICYLLLISVVAYCLSACSSGTNKNVLGDISSTVSSNNSSSEEKSDMKEYEMYGFVYKYPDSLIPNGRSSGLRLYNSEESVSLFICEDDLSDFSSWNSTVDDSRKKLFSAMSNACFEKMTMEKQSVQKSEQITNKNGLELMRVEGTVTGYDVDGKDIQSEYIVYYHLTESKKIRCFFTLIKDDKYFTSISDRNEADKILKNIADNLKADE